MVFPSRSADDVRVCILRGSGVTPGNAVAVDPPSLVLVALWRPQKIMLFTGGVNLWHCGGHASPKAWRKPPLNKTWSSASLRRNI